MICNTCNCYTEEEHGQSGEDCLTALLEWRKEAEARLAMYEELAAARRSQDDR